MEIWSNEAQERIIVGIHQDKMELLQKVCQEENCPLAIVGEITEGTQFIVKDGLDGDTVMDMDMEELL